MNWITSGQNAENSKENYVFFSVRVKLKSSSGRVSILLWSSIQFFSCHGRPDNCEYGSLNNNNSDNDNDNDNNNNFIFQGWHFNKVAQNSFQLLDFDGLL